MALSCWEKSLSRCDAYPTLSEGVFWTAWEMAQPFGTGQEATRGVESPYVGEHAPDPALQT